MTFGDVTNAQGTCRNINHVIQGECFQVKPGSSCLWKRAFPLPPSALLSKHTLFIKNFLFFACIQQSAFTSAISMKRAWPSHWGQAQTPQQFYPVSCLPGMGGRSTCLHCRGKAGYCHCQGQQASHKAQSHSPSLLTSWGFRYFPSLMTSGFVFMSTNTHPMEN